MPQSSAMAALRCYSSSAAIIVPRRKICARASMDGCSGSESRQRASGSVSATCKVNKVYEDKNMGILCYIDEKGELVCEGLDEGPRLTRRDMEKLAQERESKNAAEDWQERALQIVGGIDWSGLQPAAGTAKK